MDDVFCRIIKGEIPSKKVYEDDRVLAILDISQATKGHVLIIPKKHAKDFFDVELEELHHVFDVARLIGEAEKKALGATSFNILTNAGELAGQTVPHFHVHLIPRYERDEFNIISPSHDVSDDDLIALAQTIKKEI